MEKLGKAIAVKGKECGYQPQQKKMPTPLTVHGVGNGSQKCDWQGECPIAVPQADGTARMGTFTAPIVSGSGADLPGLLGLRSMEQQRAILDTRGRTLILPGPGPVEIQLPPGSVCVPLEKAPSGHLVMVVDEFHKISQTSGGVRETPKHFLAGAENTPPNPTVITETADPGTLYTTTPGQPPTC